MSTAASALASRPTDADLAAWRARHAQMVGSWQAEAARATTVAEQLVPLWQTRLGELGRVRDTLVQSGRWRGGPRTLLAAVSLQHLELVMTAGLAWLLRPDGHHGLGNGLLTEVLGRVGVVTEGAPGAVRILTEEQRGDTRADLVVYGPSWTVVFEAKTFALEQPAQLDRLYRGWSEEPGATFVFLTRGERSTKTALTSKAAWQGLTWADIARLARSAVAGREKVAPGTLDYIATLEAYHNV